MALSPRQNISMLRKVLRRSFLLRHGLALLIVGFFAIFAPLICIVHCQVLDHPTHAVHGHPAPDAQSAPRLVPRLLALASFVAPPATRQFLCDFALTVPATPPALPSETTLPPVVHDLLPALLLTILMPLLAEAMPLVASADRRAHDGALPLPPPKATLRFA